MSVEDNGGYWAAGNWPHSGTRLTLKVTPPSPDPTRYEYQWFRSGTKDPNATGPTYGGYIIGPNDHGHTLTAEITAIKDGYPNKTYSITCPWANPCRETVAGQQRDVTFSRISGASRYDTAAALANKFYPNATEAFIATGSNFPDALAAAAAAGNKGAPVLLIDENNTTAAITQLNTLKDLKTIHLIGGTNAITPQTENELKAKVK